MDLLGPDKLTIAEIQQMCNAGQLARAATAELEDLGKELASALADPGPGPALAELDERDLYELYATLNRTLRELTDLHAKVFPGPESAGAPGSAEAEGRAADHLRRCDVTFLFSPSAKLLFRLDARRLARPGELPDFLLPRFKISTARSIKVVVVLLRQPKDIFSPYQSHIRLLCAQHVHLILDLAVHNIAASVDASAPVPPASRYRYNPAQSRRTSTPAARVDGPRVNLATRSGQCNEKRRAFINRPPGGRLRPVDLDRRRGCRAPAES
jgi:hypothetical protein